jgi:hypothetical protein
LFDKALLSPIVSAPCHDDGEIVLPDAWLKFYASACMRRTLAAAGAIG